MPITKIIRVINVNWINHETTGARLVESMKEESYCVHGNSLDDPCEECASDIEMED